MTIINETIIHQFRATRFLIEYFSPQEMIGSDCDGSKFYLAAVGRQKIDSISGNIGAVGGSTKKRFVTF